MQFSRRARHDTVTSHGGQTFPWAAMLAAMTLTTAAIGQTFFFSTGNPDGLMATAARPGPGPGSGANQETESGDDFILASTTYIDSATITGLLPLGASLNDVSQVRVEIYRVFPKDSDVGRTSGPPTFSTPQVPTRVNSPADVELVDRDSMASNLTFTAGVVSTPFSSGDALPHGSDRPAGLDSQCQS